MKLPYKEGTWFAVPLRQGGFAIGLIARTTPRGKVILGYFFGPRRESVPTVSEISGLFPDDAIRILRFGDLALIEGKWPVIDHCVPWDRSNWPMPPFVRIDDISGKLWKVYYSDTDPNRALKEEPISGEGVFGERDAVLGSGAVELVLTEILEQ